MTENIDHVHCLMDVNYSSLKNKTRMLFLPRLDGGGGGLILVEMDNDEKQQLSTDCHIQMRIFQPER